MRIIKHYIDHNFSRRTNGAKIEWIVIHYAGIVGAQGRAALVAQSLCRASKTECDDKLKRTASTHYIVGDDGIYQLVRDKHRAWHCGGYSTANKCSACNNNSIGVDLVERKWNTKSGSVNDPDWYFSETVILEGAELVAKIADMYNIPDDHIIRHFDVTGKKCPRPFVGDDVNVVLGETHNHEWRAFKKRIADARGKADSCGN